MKRRRLRHIRMRPYGVAWYGYTCFCCMPSKLEQRQSRRAIAKRGAVREICDQLELW